MPLKISCRFLKKYPKQLLIVKDDEIQRDAISELFRKSQEMAIIGVSSQEEAIHEIEKGVYDAAIIDLGLRDGMATIFASISKNRILPCL